ncbi:hypothetical protein D3C84_1027810 [compost metagenome]
MKFRADKSLEQSLMRGKSTGVIAHPITAGPVQQGNQQLIFIIAPGFSLANIGDAFLIFNA